MKKLLPAAFGACLFAFILGARWAVCDRFGTDLPEWDQWDAEGTRLLAPWFAHDHFFQALFEPQNEHRVVLTKLLNLGVALANGQWDQRLETTVNPLLPASIAVAFLFFARRYLLTSTLPWLWMLLAVGFGLPVAWQNVLGGFHSQQYFLIALAFATLALLPFSKPFSLRWWLGSVACALGLLSMASGFFAAVVVLVLLCVLWLKREIALRDGIPTAIVCVVVVAVGWLTRREMDYHDALKAHNFSDFALTIIRSLQWPAPFSPWFALVIWLPWTWLTIRVLLPGGSFTPALRAFGYVVIGFGGWVGLQLIATGYARGAGGPSPASRYLDTLVFGLVANALALAWLVTPGITGGLARRGLAGLAAAWIGLLAWGIGREVRESLFVVLPSVKIHYDSSKQNVRNYLLTGDAKHLDHPDIPYPSASLFLSRINVPSLRNVLPASVRPPLPMMPAHGDFVLADSEKSLSETGLPSEVHPLEHRLAWGSFSKAKNEDVPREFTSVPLRSPLGGYLRFETAGHVGERGVTLELRDAGTGASLGPIASNKIPGDAWRAAFVAAPAGEFVVYARAPDLAHWLAVSQPTEMATGSFWAWQISKRGLVVAGIAVALAAGLGVLAWLTRDGLAREL